MIRVKRINEIVNYIDSDKYLNFKDFIKDKIIEAETLQNEFREEITNEEYNTMCEYLHYLNGVNRILSFFQN